MKVSDAVNRGYNFFVVSLLGILAGSLISELSQETEWLFRIDELAVIAIGIIAVTWYLTGRHRFTRSWIPVLLAFLALAAKALGLLVELHDTLEVGDDIGLVQTLLLLAIVASVAFWLVGRQVRTTGV